ncbi:hypothetical protein FO519_006427 [Halicephalobus sp. NKZ332]|nr:hypothetical protein FO519_006427 [Halicephalobus sp. NKZ332]
MSDLEDNYNRTVSGGGIAMIVIASLGVLTVITTIICLFVTSKKRIRVDSRLQSATSRNLSVPRNPRSTPRNLEEGSPPAPHARTVLPMFPDFGAEFGKLPPTYDEAIRLPTPTTPNAPPLSPRGIPPPAFDEVSIHEQSSSGVVPSGSQVTGTLVSSGNHLKANTTESSPADLNTEAESCPTPKVISDPPSEVHE